jgi:NAD(P)-dependent dehydrogenase (short-subunit alcohol dehydrogenase family)
MQNIVVTGTASGLGRGICTRFVHLDASARMVTHGYGRLLQHCLGRRQRGNAGMMAYSASKAAVIGMTKVSGAKKWPAQVSR